MNVEIKTSEIELIVCIVVYSCSPQLAQDNASRHSVGFGEGRDGKLYQVTIISKSVSKV